MPEAQTWQQEASAEEEDPELETRPTVRMAPPIRIGDAVEEESFDEDAEHEQTSGDEAAADAAVDGDEIESKAEGAGEKR